jgi:hypothetical protein
MTGFSGRPAAKRVAAWAAGAAVCCAVVLVHAQSKQGLPVNP